MKTSAFFTALVTTISIVHFARAASVGGAGYTNDFIVGPGPADWGTSSRSGSSSDAYNPDIEVNTINVAGVNGQLAASLDNPPLQAALATWSSSGLYIQTRATANRCTLLVGKFINNTGSNATQIAFSYLFTVAGAGTPEESGKGNRAYYSLSGAAGSWINLPSLNTVASANGSSIVSTNIAIDWTNGASLYLLWMDDNANGSGFDSANQIDNFSLRVTAGTPPRLNAVLVTPPNNEVVLSGNALSASTAVSFGTAPYTVEYFTNTGAGNAVFTSAGTSSTTPFNVALGSLGSGTYNIYAVASDSGMPMASAFTATNTFFVADRLLVALEAPADGARFDYATPVTGRAAISGGTSPYSVQFFLDDIATGAPVTSAPYERNFGALFVGDHTIRAVVTDARGWVSNSVSHRVHITGPLGVTFIPTNGAGFTYGQQMVLSAIVGGGTGPYTVTFYTNGQPAGSINSAPFVLDLGILPTGVYHGYVRVTDSSAPVPQEAQSTASIFHVAPNILSILLTEPDDGDPALEGAPYGLSALAFVNAPVTIANVQFFYEDILVGVDTNEPYFATLTNHVEGTRRIHAAATDSLGRRVYSATNQVTVINGRPVPNDDFANAIPLSGPVARAISHNLSATKEPGEPNHADVPGPGSVWWTWTPSTSGSATIDTFASTFDTLLAVYIGNGVSQLTLVAGNDDSGSLQSRVQFNATTGTVYRIAIDGYSSSRGLIALNIRGSGALEIESPTNGMVGTVGDPIIVSARILPDFPNPPPNRVEFYRGENLLASLTNEPFTVIDTNAPPGSNTFHVVAWDAQGTRIQSSSVTVFVQVIGVMVLTPFANTVFSTTNPITITTWTYLPIGSMTNVEFFIDGFSIGVDNTFPFSAVWTNVTGGSHRLMAVGRSDTGAFYRSEAVNIGVVRTFVPLTAVWRYRDDGSDQGTNWIRREFDDSSWARGPAPLGYGDSGGRFPATTNASGHATIYYRHTFVVTNVAGLNSLNTRIERDDGAIVYLNGVEIARYNMPAGPIVSTDYASQAAFDDGQIAFFISASTTTLVEGTNTLAVEIHQEALDGTDLWFQMNLEGFPIIIQNLPPLVSITNPTNNQYYLTPSSITIEADVSDADGTVARVEFFANSTRIGQATNAPYSVVWSAPNVGTYTITARATDGEGATGISPSVPIVVYDALGTPLAQITSPAHGAVMEGPTNLLVTAAAYAISGVTNVQFLANGQLFGEDNVAPYSVIWAAPFGTNALTAIAFDDSGIAGTSTVVTVTITIPPTNVVPPMIIARLPPDGSIVTNLTSVSVRFSEYIQNVDASDLLINGVPAASVNGNHSRSNFTFTFPQPPYGRVIFTWAANHGITDYGWPTVLPFDHNGEGAAWSYTLVDQTPPTIVARAPAPGSTVTNLSQIAVTFSEAVTGVDAADLRLNGTPAFEVTGSGSNYVFRVTQPSPGTMSVSWATNHEIFDLAATPNPFNRTGPSAIWNFILDTRTVLIQSNSMWRFVKGTNEPSIPTNAWRQLAFDDFSWSNSSAPFFYGDPYDSAQYPGTLLSDMLTNYSTVYLRTEFTVLNRALVTNLWLNAQSDDGFIAWLNGVEIRRYNAPPGEVPYNTFASGVGPEPQNRGAAYILTALPNAVAALVDGRNVLAVQGLNQGPVSSDFGFNAQLYTYPADLTTVGPGLLPPAPPQGDVLYLTNITITFTEPVRGVDATDLLVNGVPAATLSAVNDSVYMFSFAQPPFGPVLVTWDANHAITDFDQPPRPFDGAAATSILAYHIVNPSSPRILTQAPLGGSSLTGLTSIMVTFNEPVAGVDAADLLVSGVPAISVSSDDGTNYNFSFDQPPFGFVTIGWAANHAIVDTEGGNGFDPTRFGGQWNYVLIDPAPAVTINSPANGTYRLEPATVTVTATATDNDGTVARVQFYEGTNLFGESTNPPYSAAISNLTLGTYVLRAVAIDNMGLTGTSAPVVLNVVTSLPAALVRGPYLQMGTPTGGVVRWRTDVPTDGLVYYGTDPENLTNFAAETVVTNEHIVHLSGLEPATRYYYSIGSAAQRLAGTGGAGSEFWFHTSPPTGTPRPTRLWVLGDPGTAGNGSPDRQNRTRDAFYDYAANNGPADLWLMLGDNAYDRGTDDEYQRAVFDIYPATLRNLFLWPTLGNHETSQSFTATDFPYLHIFSLPQNGEAGGVASGTKKYYSFDYANIHFVCLDSMTSGQNANSPMANWLRTDLAAATAHWVIVFFHHPPYTKGNHDSDRERELIDIRQNLVPIMEEYGVDLVLCGHSHAWERSYLLHGHYGFSSTLSESMKIDGGDGREDGTGAYRKNVAGQGVVYTVAGNAGQVTGGSLDHAAHYVSFNELGTMVIDVNGNRLDAIFLREDGQIPDRFTLLKPDLRPAAPLHLLALPAGPAEVNLQWHDMAVNELGYSIERSLDGVHFTEHLTAPMDAVTALDTGLVQNVTYFYRVRGTNSAGISDYSNIASVTPGSATSPPQAPLSLVAISDDGIRFYRSQMLLSWQDRSSDEAAFQIERSHDALLFVPVATVGANVTVYVDHGLDSATAYFYRVRAINAIGPSGPSSLSGDQTHPQSQLVRAGDTVTFHAGVEGAPPVTYQWRFMGDILPGETNEALTFAADLANAGEYSVLVTDSASTHVSNPATLAVVSPPIIVSQPEDYIRGTGMSVEFAVDVEGTPPFAYHWRRNGAPVGISASVLSLPDISLADRGGYDVVIENNFGSVTSRVATLQVYAVPGLAPVPDLFAEVLRPLFVTNVAIDSNIPPLNLQYALGPDAPTNAYIHPLSGLFRWVPNRSQAPGTNTITVSVFDQASPILSNAMSFNVYVNDYVELSLGSVIMLAGTNGVVPISLFSSLPLTEIRAVLGFAGQYFTDISLEQPGLPAASAALQRVDPNTVTLTFTAPSGGTLVGSNQLTGLRVVTGPLTNSTAVPLRITSLSATAAQTISGEPPTMLAGGGQVVIVGTRPLLEAHLTQGARELTIYARPGLYQLQWTTNLVDPVTWRLRGNATINSNLFLLIRTANVPPTNMPGFFRVRQ